MVCAVWIVWIVSTAEVRTDDAERFLPCCTWREIEAMAVAETARVGLWGSVCIMGGGVQKVAVWCYFRYGMNSLSAHFNTAMLAQT